MTHDEILDDMIRNQRALKELADVDCASFAAPYNTKTAADGTDVASIAREAGIKTIRMHQTAAGGKMTAERMNAIVDGVRRKGGGRIVFMIHGMARGYDAWENPDELRRHLEWVKALPDVRVLRHSPQIANPG